MPELNTMSVEAKEKQKLPLAPRWKSRRGNAFIEFALAGLPFLALFLGVIEISTMVFIKSALQNAVRDGVRFAITYQTTYNGTACATQTDCVRRVIVANSLGFINNSNSSLVQVRYYNPNYLGTPLTPGTVGTGFVLCGNIATCSPLDSTPLQFMNQPGNLVEVAIEGFNRDWMAAIKAAPSAETNALPGTGIRMSAASSDILQGLPTGSFTPPAP